MKLGLPNFFYPILDADADDTRSVIICGRGLNGYSWYWISDEDVDLTHLNLRRNSAGDMP
jgi:hypothetical protein